MRSATLVLLAACAAPLTYRTDARWSEADTSAIDRAAAKVNALTGGHRPLTKRPDGAWLVEPKDLPLWNGLCSPSNRRIWIRQPPTGASVEAVATHEFGHMVGMGHVCAAPGTQGENASGRVCVPGQPMGVMDPSHVVNEWTALDREECRRVGACRKGTP